MKNLLPILSMLLSTSLSAVEYGVLSDNGILNNNPTLTINDGYILEIISASESNGSNSLEGYSIDVNFNDTWNVMSSKMLFTERLFDLPAGNKYVGPMILKFNLGSHDDSRAYISYKLMSTSELEYKNVNIISLPSSSVGQGTHEIVVEASDDLQSWTPVHSSSIGGDKAFFRTRVVEAE